MNPASNVIAAFSDNAAPPSQKKWQRVWINKKFLTIAFIIEAVIVGAVLFANWQFAERYSGDSRLQWWMAIICGISYAAVEVARVPLAITAAAHRRRSVRIIAVLTLLFAVVITTEPQPGRRTDVLAASRRGRARPRQRLRSRRQTATALSPTMPTNARASRRSTPRSQSSPRR